MSFIKITLEGLFVSLRDILNQKPLNNVNLFKFAMKSSVRKYLM
jgi:hypothetical protein